MALTSRQRRFVQEYLVDLNGTQAAIRAGYAKKSADVESSRLLGNAGVRALITAAQAKRAKELKLEANDILRELMRLGTSDVGDVFHEDGRMLPIKDIPLATRRAIASIEVEAQFDEDEGQQVTTTKVKFWDKPKALELLAKHLRLLVDRVEHSASGPVTISINGISADPTKVKS